MNWLFLKHSFRTSEENTRPKIGMIFPKIVIWKIQLQVGQMKISGKEM